MASKTGLLIVGTGVTVGVLFLVSSGEARKKKCPSNAEIDAIIAEKDTYNEVQLIELIVGLEHGLRSQKCIEQADRLYAGLEPEFLEAVETEAYLFTQYPLSYQAEWVTGRLLPAIARAGRTDLTTQVENILRETLGTFPEGPMG